MPSTQFPLVKKVTIFANSIAIGQAIPLSAPYFEFKWVVPLWTYNQLTNEQNPLLSAEIISSDGASSCVINSTTAFMTTGYPTAPLPSYTVSPTSLSTQTNQTMPFTAKLWFDNWPDIDFTKYALYEWTTNLGSNVLSILPNIPDNFNAQFTSGSTGGVGSATVQMYYGGITKSLSIPVNIVAPIPTPITTEPTTSTTTTPTTTQTKLTTSSTIAPTTATTTASPTATTALASNEQTNKTAIQTPQEVAAQAQNSPIVKSCVESTLSPERYTQISTSTLRPMSEEITKINSCFVTSNYILPHIFSPIEPLSAKKLPTDDMAVVAKLENKNKKFDSGNRDVLKISGRAQPNSTILVYVFSDPLVITTKTDGNGNWEYTLENPLEPGKHEVYAVVNKGDGTLKRSSPMTFFIAKAEASELNPKGLSLQLSPTATPTVSRGGLTGYIIASVSLIVLAVGGFFIVITVKHRKPLVQPFINQITPLQPSTDQDFVKTSEPTPSSPINLPSAGQTISPNRSDTTSKDE